MELKLTDRLEKAASRLSIPAQAAPGVPVMTVSGRGTVVIESKGTILEYGRELVTVSCGSLIMKLRGADLELKTMTGQGLVITGTLSGVDFDTF